MSENEVIEEEKAPRTRKKPIVLIGVLTASVLVGGAVGVFVTVPLLVGSAPVKVETTAVEDSLSAEQSARSARGKDRTPILFTVDNMVLNPRGTGGTRFLMVSAALEVRNASVLEQMKIREHEIRDAMLHAFGQKSVEELADLEQREALREDVRSAIEALLQPGTVERVYLPQFVIQ